MKRAPMEPPVSLLEHCKRSHPVHAIFTLIQPPDLHQSIKSSLPGRFTDKCFFYLFPFSSIRAKQAHRLCCHSKNEIILFIWPYNYIINSSWIIWFPHQLSSICLIIPGVCSIFRFSSSQNYACHSQGHTRTYQTANLPQGGPIVASMNLRAQQPEIHKNKH
jgi:hypothetical protein